MGYGIPIWFAATAFAVVMLAVFVAAWLERRNTERVFNRFERHLDGRFDMLETQIDHIAGPSHLPWNGELDRVELQSNLASKPAFPADKPGIVRSDKSGAVRSDYYVPEAARDVLRKLS